GHGAELLVGALEAAAMSDRATADEPVGWAVTREAPHLDAPALAGEASAELRRASARFAALSSADAGGWLEPGYAAAFAGAPARAAWAVDLSAAAEACSAAAEDLEALAAGLDSADVPWLDDAQRPDQDYGAMGLRQLVAKLHEQL